MFNESTASDAASLVLTSGADRAPGPSSRERILVVDSSGERAARLTAVLVEAGHGSVVTAAYAPDAVQMLTDVQPDLVLLGPPAAGDGGSLMSEFRAAAGAADLPIVVLGDHLSPAQCRAVLEAGAADVIAAPPDATGVVPRVRNLIALRRARARLADQESMIDARVRERLEAAVAARMDRLAGLAMQAEARDDPSGEHLERVSRLAGELAQALGLPDDTVALIRRAAPVHDIGMIAIPESLLHKAGGLSAAETALMRAHTTIGASMLGGGDHPLLLTAERIAASHHERWDGKGYPHGLEGEAIPMEARIMAVADVFDALTHDRPYRHAMPRAFALLDIVRGAGTQFDPAVANAMRRLSE